MTQPLSALRHPGPLHALPGLVIALLLLGGCGSAGSLRVEAINPNPGQTLRDQFDTAIYRATGPTTMDVVLVAGPTDDPQAALHIRMLYRPKPGTTPVDSNATSTVMHYLVFEADQVRVYGGAGMLYVRDKLGSQQIAGTLRNGTLRLLDAGPPTTQADDDPEAAQTIDLDPQTVTSAIVNGQFTADRDDLATVALLRQLRQRISDALTYPRLVDATPTTAP